MLPMYPELTDEDVRYVAGVVKEFYRAGAYYGGVRSAA